MLKQNNEQFCVNKHDTFICGRNGRGDCKLCKKAVERRYYLSHRDVILAKSKVYNDLHQDEITKYHKKLNLEKGHEHRRKPKNRYIILKGLAKRRKLEFNITKKDYFTLISYPCHYCQKSLLDETGGGLDRIDNDKGYTLDNVLSCCGTCNKIRGDSLTVEETVVAIQAVLAYRNIGD
jgi:hypothetical protein